MKGKFKHNKYGKVGSRLQLRDAGAQLVQVTAEGHAGHPAAQPIGQGHEHQQCANRMSHMLGRSMTAKGLRPDPAAPPMRKPPIAATG
jgi:hypothetical protein